MSVMPSQPLVTLNDDLLGVVDLLVGIFLQALVAEIADQAFVQDVVAGDLGRAVARDQRERIQRHRRVADIGDFILDGEEIALVDRDGALEGEAFAIVVFQRRPGSTATARRSLPAATSCSGRACGWSSRRPAPSRIRRNRGSAVCDGENSTIAGEFGIDRLADTGSARRRRCARPSARCCRRYAGVSILTRGVAAIAASRGITTVDG